MLTEVIINDADEKVKSLCIENERLRLWLYILLGTSTLFGVVLIYCFCYIKFRLHKSEISKYINVKSQNS
jgi:hypothetical protein